MKKKITKTEKLLKFAQKKGTVTRKDLVSFLVRLNKDEYGTNQWVRDDSNYNALLYGTTRRTGLFETYFTKTKNGYRFRKNKKIQGPFTRNRFPTRTQTTAPVSDVSDIPVL